MKDKFSQHSGLYFGSVKFSGIGGFREKMISELLENGISVRNIKFTDVGISGEVSPSDYFITAKTARRNGVKIRSGARRGLYFDLVKYKRRVGIYIGALIFITSLSLWQTRVQDIAVTGDESESIVLSILAESGIVRGAKINGLRLSEAEHRLMLEVENCAWVDVSCEGFRVNARVEKGTEIPEMETSEPQNIVASRNAKIVGQIVREGHSEIAYGDEVTAGQLLVSGVFSDGGDGTLVVHSEAEIIGEWQETTEFYVPFREDISVPEGEKTTFKYLVVGGETYPLFFGKAFRENSLYTEETRVVKLFGEQTALKIREGTFTEYVTKTIQRSPETCVSELSEMQKNYEENFLSGYDISSCAEMYFPDENGVKLVLNYVIHGNIARPQPIEFGTDPASHSRPSDES